MSVLCDLGKFFESVRASTLQERWECLNTMSCLTEKKYVKNVKISIVKTGSKESNITYLFSLLSKDLIRRLRSLQAASELPGSTHIVQAGVHHTLRRVSTIGGECLGGVWWEKQLKSWANRRSRANENSWNDLIEVENQSAQLQVRRP